MGHNVVTCTRGELQGDYFVEVAYMELEVSGRDAVVRFFDPKGNVVGRITGPYTTRSPNGVRMIRFPQEFYVPVRGEA